MSIERTRIRVIASRLYRKSGGRTISVRHGQFLHSPSPFASLSAISIAVFERKSLRHALCDYLEKIEVTIARNGESRIQLHKVQGLQLC